MGSWGFPVDFEPKCPVSVVEAAMERSMPMSVGPTVTFMDVSVTHPSTQTGISLLPGATMDERTT